jgi:tripartite-type tricarboxylate transporter receptor subunit TctC
MGVSMTRLRQYLVPLCAAVLCGGATVAFAQTSTYPQRPIRLIIPVSVGGATDIVGRIVVQRLAPALGQQLVVDNRSGAGGIIGTELVARATPDGYTLLFAYASHTIMPFLSRKVPYDPDRDFAAMGQVGASPLVLTVHSALPANSVQELVAMARAKPGQVRAGAPGMGGVGHIAAEIFKQVSKTDITTVIYKGGAPAQLALAQGEVQFVFATPPAAMAQIKAGRVKILATSAQERMSYLPDVPTFAEAGLPGIDVMPWQGFLAPAGTPRAIIASFNQTLNGVLREPDTVSRLSIAGSDVVTSTPEALAAKIRKELAYFERVIRTAKIKPME